MIGRLPDFVRIWIWGPIVLFATFLPLLLSQILQMMTIVVLPFSKPLFRDLNTRVAGGIWSYWAWALQTVDGMEIVVTGDPIPARENAIVINNHQEMGDIVLLMALAMPRGRVCHMKWLVKDVVKYVPGIGWGLLFLDCVFLKRNWLRDADTIRRVFSRINDNKLPVWLCSFPEGTRATPAKLLKQQQRDKARGLEPFQYVLRPKHKGFAASVAALSEHVTSVYSVTTYYHGGVPSLPGLIRGDCRKATVDVRRTSVASLPKGEAGLEAWIVEQYRQKDRRLADFKAADVLLAK